MLLNLHDLIVSNNKMFGDYIKDTFSTPLQLTVEKANKSDDLANYVGLAFIKDGNNGLSNKLYQRAVKDTIDDSFPDWFHGVIPLRSFRFLNSFPY